MINFNYKGIRIDATTQSIPQDYKDAGNRNRTRFERRMQILFHFWDFTIWDGNLTELSFVKAVLLVFIHNSRKRVTKEGSKIDLEKALHRNDPCGGAQSLWFIARQKNKKHYLYVCLQSKGNTINEIYLDEIEVAMLEIALSKAINLLTPEILM